ncbi:ethanolamine permease [Flavihumibacter petaseus]|uniref:Putative ethanolamine permease n=1 Tax=Flavihumibacter petaseus NBRC 106054 TaxID=1220578 RepID=A0A0E9MVF4_9BACT|nr:ethanolamine permease [Flavihumibacter petaseus]GAO41463.1 putative ethanolamine permease [Flavihumibacter petaseus NBRC 106054]
MTETSGHGKPALKKSLTALHLWGIAVGLVISGEYFGWNYGWAVAGTMGMLIASFLVLVLYITFVFSFTELTTAIPNAGGPFAYAFRALGPLGGLIAGYATLIEFLFATPAIAFALGSYLHFLYPAVDVLYAAIGSYLVFTLINLIGIKESAVFTLVVTLLAVAELVFYTGIVAPHFKWGNFMQDNMPFGWAGVFAALPFAIWLFLAIEGVAMVAEEAKDPQRTIPKGYILGMATLAVLAMVVMIVTGGVTNWQKLSHIDYPLPEAIGFALGKTNSLTKLFAGIGLFGLIASFHSIITGYSRQIFALARASYLPPFLSHIHPRFKTPHWALTAGALVGIIALCLGHTDKLIIISALGALVMYIVSMISLFVLRKKEPSLERPFPSPFYPWFPVIACVLSAICLVALVYYNPWMSLVFFGGMVLVAVLFIWMRKKTAAQKLAEESTVAAV